MSDPTTSNILLAVPSRGSDVGTWDVPVNSNSSALDGFLGGVQTVSVSSSPVTLTAPSGTVTTSGGPTQSQNAVLVFTGTLTANVQVTFPLPGYYIISNQTTGNFVLTLKAAGSGNIIGVEQGVIQHTFNDGTNFNFVNLGRIGGLENWVGYTALPAWVTACTSYPYLLCDGTIYNISDYPVIGKRLGSAFGGNGLTTFGVPDLRGRVSLPYDGTGARITTTVCGINGQTLGASGGDQNVQIHTHPFTGTPATITVSGVGIGANQIGNQTGSGSVVILVQGNGGAGSASGPYTPAGTNANFGTGVSQNIQPAQVTGISVIRAA